MYNNLEDLKIIFIKKMSEKIFVSSDELSDLSIQLAKKILKSNYIPDAIIGISRGGCVPSIYVHEYLNFKNIHCIYGIINAKSYNRSNKRETNTDIDISNRLLNQIKTCKNILIIDDILDTGYTFMDIGYFLCKNYLKSHQFSFATVYYKNNNNKTTIIPRFYLIETSKWVVFPHELLGLNNTEIIRYKKNI